MSHTPAPWRELVTRIDDARGYQICHLDLHGKSEAERDANRRLIASAPDLLEACQWCIALCEEIGATETNAYASARAAITRATGETA